MGCHGIRVEDPDDARRRAAAGMAERDTPDRDRRRRDARPGQDAARPSTTAPSQIKKGDRDRLKPNPRADPFRYDRDGAAETQSVSVAAVSRSSFRSPALLSPIRVAVPAVPGGVPLR